MRDFYRQNLNLNRIDIPNNKGILKLMLRKSKGIEIYWKTDDCQEIRFYEEELPPCESSFRYTVRNSDKIWDKTLEILLKKIESGMLQVSGRVATITQPYKPKNETWTEKRKAKKINKKRR